MSESPDNNADDDPTGNEGNIKKLRDAADQGAKDRAELEVTKRELAFSRAGIDTSTKLGGMLAKTYEGDLTDVAALKAEWQELNPATGQAPETPPETAPTPEGFQNPEDQQAHREQVTSAGKPAGDQPEQTKDPVELAYERFHSDLQRPIDDRREGAMATVLEAYLKGDPRVMFDKEAHRQQAMNASISEGAQ